MKIATELEVTSEMIADQMVTAFEGGVNYWVEGPSRSRARPRRNPWYSDRKLYEQDFDHRDPRRG